MAALPGTFDPSAVPEDENRPSFDPIPSGWYPGQIVETDVVPTKAGTGTLLKFTAEIMSGPHERRKVFGQINLQNPNAQAEQIGQRELADLCEAAGVGAISDSSELHFKPVMMRVGTSKPQQGYETKNEVKAWKAYDANQTAPAPRPAAAAPASRPAAAAPPPQAAVAAAGGQRRPWGN